MVNQVRGESMAAQGFDVIVVGARVAGAATAAPRAEFATFRTDIEGHYLTTLDSRGDLGDRVRAGVRAERFRTTPDLPNTLRVPSGPGWALVGDAGLVMDPITAQGIGNALHEAEMLTGAVSRQAEIDRFLGVFAGVTPIRQYRSPRNLLRLLGVGGLARIAAATLGQAVRRSASGAARR